MLPEPLVITENAVANNLRRISFGNQSGSFATSDGKFRVDISHQNRKDGSVSSMIKLTRIVQSTNPITGLPVFTKVPVHLVFIQPPANTGIVDDTIKGVIKAFLDAVDSDTTLSALLGLES